MYGYDEVIYGYGVTLLYGYGVTVVYGYTGGGYSALGRATATVPKRAAELATVESFIVDCGGVCEKECEANKLKESDVFV